EQPGEVTTLKGENGDEVDKNDHLATIKSQMGSQNIYAPTDGEIAHLHTRENNFLSNEDPLAFIIDSDELQANFAVTQTVRDHFKQDEEVTLVIDDEKYKGNVLPIDTMPDETGQFTITVTFENE